MSAATGESGILHDFIFYDASNQVWNGSAFVAWNDADYLTYRVPAMEDGASGEFPLPPVPVGAVRYVMRERGATLALSYPTYKDWTPEGQETAVRSAVGLESANLASLVNAVVGKQNVTSNGDGTYDIAIRNATDDATLVTIRYNPETGVKTVV